MTKKDTFNVATCRALCKEESNHYLATETPPKKNILYLEGPGLRTTKILLKHKHYLQYYWIPNNTDSYYKIRKKVNNTYKETVNDFVRRFKKSIGPRLRKNKKPNKFYSVYLDYCDSFNEEAKDTLTFLLSNRMLENKSELGMTHCSRTNKKNNRGHANQAMLECIRFVQRTAEKNGYKAAVVDDVGGTYRRTAPMYTLWFKITRPRVHYY